jgi:hypothetical protein
MDANFVESSEWVARGAPFPADAVETQARALSATGLDFFTFA